MYNFTYLFSMNFYQKKYVSIVTHISKVTVLLFLEWLKSWDRIPCWEKKNVLHVCQTALLHHSAKTAPFRWWGLPWSSSWPRALLCRRMNERHIFSSVGQCAFPLPFANFSSPAYLPYLGALHLAHLSQQPYVHWQLAGSLPAWSHSFPAPPIDLYIYWYHCSTLVWHARLWYSKSSTRCRLHVSVEHLAKPRSCPHLFPRNKSLVIKFIK